MHAIVRDTKCFPLLVVSHPLHQNQQVIDTTGALCANPLAQTTVCP